MGATVIPDFGRGAASLLEAERPHDLNPLDARQALALPIRFTKRRLEGGPIALSKRQLGAACVESAPRGCRPKLARDLVVGAVTMNQVLLAKRNLHTPPGKLEAPPPALRGLVERLQYFARSPIITARYKRPRQGDSIPQRLPAAAH